MNPATIQNNGLACSTPRSKHAAKTPYAEREVEWRERQQRGNKARRMTLTADQMTTIKALRGHGQSFRKIARTLGIGEKCLRREWRSAGFSFDNPTFRALSAIQLAVLNKSAPARARSGQRMAELHQNPEFRQKILVAFIARNRARRFTLFPNEVEIVRELRRAGRSISYIAEEIGIGHEQLSREMRANGLSTAPLKRRRVIERSSGPWRSSDPVEGVQPFSGGAWS